MRDLARWGVVGGAASLARLRFPAGARPAPGMPGAPRVLVLRPDHLGDVLLSTPALSALRAALPQAHIVALLGPWAVEALRANPAIDELHQFAFPGFTRRPCQPSSHPYWQLIELARRIKAWEVDAAINFRSDFWWGSAALALAGVPMRVGFAVAPGSAALTYREPFPSMPEHAARLALRLSGRTARLLGAPLPAHTPLDPTSWPLVFAIAPEDHRWAESWLAQHAITAENPPIFVHPGAGAAVKLWTARQWAQTAERLAADTGAPLVIAGATTEGSEVGRVVAQIASSVHVVSLTEPVSLARYGALISRARLALGVDSGPLHLAVAVGTPSVRLHGPTDPTVFGPWGNSALHAVVASDLPCVPCGRLDYPADELANHPCVRVLRPSTVCATAHAVLASAAGAPSDANRITASPSGSVAR